MRLNSDNLRSESISRDRPRVGNFLLSSQFDSVFQKLFGREELSETRPFETYDTRDIWTAVDEKSISRGKEVTLYAASLTDWIPRWPGLFQTDFAKEMRELASTHLLRDDDPRMKEWEKRDPISFKEREAVHSVRGKGSKLMGGVGCVRLAAFERSDGRWYLLNAFKTDDLETGVPLVVPEAIFDMLIDEIHERGFAVGVNVHGVLRDAPDSYSDAYTRDRPRIVLEVRSISRGDGVDCHPTVSVPISFAVAGDEADEIYHSYANFPPGDQDGYRSAVDFLDRIYVGYLYGGRVLTDFDETEQRFDDAIFSLKSISSGSVADAKISRKLERALGGGAWRARFKKTQTIIVEKQMNTYKADRGSVILGAGASARDINTNSDASGSDIDLAALIQELGTLRASMKSEADDNNASHDLEIGKVAEAEQAAKDGDTGSVYAALKSVGVWGLGIAEKVGVKIATKIITDQME